MNAAVTIVSIASTLLAAAIFLFGAARPGYSQIHHTISELGELGARNANAVSFGVFLPFGIAMVLVAWLCEAQSVVGARLATCIAIGYVGAALFPCDPGSPVIGSWRQSVHNLAGAAQYVGGGAVLWQMRSASALFELAAPLVWVAAGLLSLAATSSVRGAIQRVAEVALLSCLIVIVSG